MPDVLATAIDATLHVAELGRLTSEPGDRALLSRSIPLEKIDWYGGFEEHPGGDVWILEKIRTSELSPATMRDWR